MSGGEREQRGYGFQRSAQRTHLLERHESRVRVAVHHLVREDIHLLPHRSRRVRHLSPLSSLFLAPLPFSPLPTTHSPLSLSSLSRYCLFRLPLSPPLSLFPKDFASPLSSLSLSLLSTRMRVNSHLIFGGTLPPWLFPSPPPPPPRPLSPSLLVSALSRGARALLSVVFTEYSHATECFEAKRANRLLF